MFGIESAIGINARNVGTGRFDVSGEIPGSRKRLIIETAVVSVKGWL
jgi:hypothetical protein